MTPTPEMIPCPRCKQPRHPSDIYWDRRRNLPHRCRSCVRELALTRSKESRQREREARARREGRTYLPRAERARINAEVREAERAIRLEKKRERLRLAEKQKAETARRNREKVRQYERARQERIRWTPKQRARRALQYAVAKGTIEKPRNCQRCSKPVLAKLLHGHHEDYSKPLEVQWLCARCHFEIDPAYQAQAEIARVRFFRRGSTPTGQPPPDGAVYMQQPSRGVRFPDHGAKRGPQPNEIGQAELAKVLGITGRQLFNLRKEGMPHRVEGKDIYYPVPATLEWYYARKYQPEDAGDVAGLPKLSESERRRAAADAEVAEMKRDQLRGLLITDEDAAREVQDFCETLMASLRAAPSRHAGKVIGLTTLPAAIGALQEITEAMIDEARTTVQQLSVAETPAAA